MFWRPKTAHGPLLLPRTIADRRALAGTAASNTSQGAISSDMAAKMYGVTTDVDALVVPTARILRVRASRGLPIAYSELAAILRSETGSGIREHDYAFSRLLEAVGRHEHDAGHPLLTAIVIYKGGSEPGAGFFSLAQSVGRLPGGSISRETRDAFWAREIAEVFRFWRDRAAAPR